MIGLPEQGKKRDIESELREIISYNPKHISLYILTVAESYPHKELIPNDDIVGQEYLRVSETMKELGFHQYEVSNYSLDGFESIHNWKYWEQASYIAMGASATGLLVAEEGTRFTWKPGGEFKTEELSKTQLDLEHLYTMSRTRKGINCSTFSDEAKYILKNYEKKNYGKFEKEQFIFNSNGFVILDSLINKII